MFLQPDPERQRVAGIYLLTLLAVLGQAGNGGQFALCGAEDLAHLVVFGLPGQLVAAGFAHGAFHQAVFGQVRHDAFQIFPGNILAIRNILQREVAVAALLGHIQHDPQGVPPFGRDHHKAAAPFALRMFPKGGLIPTFPVDIILPISYSVNGS